VTRRLTVPDLERMKAQGDKITMLTAYDCLFAGLIDAAGIDIILIGDSLGMVVMGYESTVPVTLEQVIHHTQAVASTAERALLVADMPFGSYEASDEQAIRNAQRLVKEGGAQAVKVEGGNELVRQRVGAIVRAGVPVMGHLGLTPQTASMLGGLRVQGREASAARQILEQARLLEEEEVFSLLFECIPADLMRRITHEACVPTIGIGAGIHCDGQVLVTHDMLGLYPSSARHVRQYCDLRAIVEEALTQYCSDVQQGLFPGDENSFRMPAEELDKLG